MWFDPVTVFDCVWCIEILLADTCLECFVTYDLLFCPLVAFDEFLWSLAFVCKLFIILLASTTELEGIIVC
jgi:hypothetical protein